MAPVVVSVVSSDSNIATRVATHRGAPPFGPTRTALPDRQPTWKAALDFSVALILLVVLLPAAVLISIAIVLDDPGPLFFRQERNGLRRRHFQIFKFRTMTAAASRETEFVQATQEDPRTTRVGRLLRRSSLDELPQLLNVLRGEMSLVGPRPHVPEMDDALAPLIDGFWERYLVKPGVTGLAQVSGYRGPTETLEKARKRVVLDRLYVRRRSLWLDVKLLLVTPFKVFGPNAF